MTKEQIDTIQRIAFFMADGTASFIPVIAPIVKELESLVKKARDIGVIPVEIPQAQLDAIASGLAAHDASKATERMMHMAKTYKRSDKE